MCLTSLDRFRDEERQKHYRITARGRSALKDWLTTPPAPTAPPRDELVTKVLVALRVPGTDVHALIQAHRRQVVDLMQQWTHFKQEEADPDVPFALMVESELTRLDAVVEWLEFADRQVERALRRPGRRPRPTLRRRVVVG